MTDERHEDPQGRHLRPVSPNSGQMVAYDPFQVRADEDDDAIDLREYWRILVKRRWVVVSVLAIFAVTTLLSTTLMIPVYRSTATVQITPPSSQILEYADFQSDQGGYYGNQQFYTTQYQILQSRELAEAVVRAEGVEEHPELTGEIRQRSLLGEIRALPSAIRRALSPSKQAQIPAGGSEAARESEERLHHTAPGSGGSRTPKTPANRP